MAESFGPVAAFYDVLMSEVPYEMWVGYYGQLLLRAGSKPRTLLDVCCGTGTVSELLALSGYELTGFDLSEPMVEIARSKASAKNLPIDYFAADATTLSLGRTFDGAYSFFDSLNYITDLDALRSAISRVGAHLTPGATFVFDLNTSYAFEQRMFDQEEVDKDAPVRYVWKGDYDVETRLIRVDMTFWWNGNEYHETHVQRAHRRSEVIEALHDAGFGEPEVFESYTFAAPRKRTDRVHYLCKKV